MSDHGGWAVLVTAARDGALVERVRASAEKHATSALEAVATAVPHIHGIAFRSCPELPATIAERIKDHRAKNVADWVMYRQALASAAKARGWVVCWYDAKSVLYSANHAKPAGPPWNADHKLALAAAIAAFYQ